MSTTEHVRPTLTAGDTAPAAWVETVTALYVEHDLPALLVDPADVVRGLDGVLQLHPWVLRHDVDALLRWAAHLDTAPGVIGYRGHITLVGELAGEPTALCGLTHRLGDGLDAVTLERLALARASELADDQAPRADYPLTLEEQADPLAVLRGRWPASAPDWIAPDLWAAPGSGRTFAISEGWV